MPSCTSCHRDVDVSELEQDPNKPRFCHSCLPPTAQLREYIRECSICREMFYPNWQQEDAIDCTDSHRCWNWICSSCVNGNKCYGCEGVYCEECLDVCICHK